ncbi:uncharacterized protein LOC143265638 [Megachile rotundata]|uniref:uncharacterized protein LOC143265638 n=1 Tax=Megachile rotundata TaxID=143995 RepID=UPI003FD4CD8B
MFFALYSSRCVRKDREEERAEEESGSAETKKAKSGGGKSRKRETERTEDLARRSKKGRKDEVSREEKEERALLEAVDAVEEAETSICELEEDFEWSEEGKQRWPLPVTSSTPWPGGKGEEKAASDPEDTERDGCRKRAKRKLPLVTEDRPIRANSDKTGDDIDLQPVIKLIRLRREETRDKQNKEAEKYSAKATARGTEQEEDNELIRLVRKMRAEDRRGRENDKDQKGNREKGKKEEGENENDRQNKHGKKKIKGLGEARSEGEIKRGEASKGEEVILITEG